MSWKICRSCSKCGKNLTKFGGVMAKQPPKSFLVVGKHLNINNLATTNAILMKLTTIMYLHETLHLAKIGTSIVGRKRACSTKKCHEIHKHSALKSHKSSLKNATEVGFLLLPYLTI